MVQRVHVHDVDVGSRSLCFNTSSNGSRKRPPAGRSLCLTNCKQLNAAELDRNLIASSHWVTDCAMVTVASEDEGLLGTGVHCQSYFTYLWLWSMIGPLSQTVC